MIEAAVSAPSQGIYRNTGIKLSKIVGSFFETTKFSIELWSKIGFSTHSFISKSGN